MKNKILYLFLLFSFSAAKADTISSWKVFYNNLKICSLTQYTKNNIDIHTSQYKKGDYLAIQYSDDMPCPKCEYEIEVVGEGKITVFKEKLKDKYKLVKIDLEDLMGSYKSKNGYSLFVVYFSEIDKKGKKDKGMRLLNIQIK